MSLTSVFGMGTGGSSSPSSPEWLRLLDLKPHQKGKKGRNSGHNIAKITKISLFSAVTFFIYQNFPETNCENDFFITFTDYSARRAELIVYDYNPYSVFIINDKEESIPKLYEILAKIA